MKFPEGRSHGACAYCKGSMHLAWPGAGGKGNILVCDKCRSTCLENVNTKEKYDWRRAK